MYNYESRGGTLTSNFQIPTSNFRLLTLYFWKFLTLYFLLYFQLTPLNFTSIYASDLRHLTSNLLQKPRRNFPLLTSEFQLLTSNL